LTHRYTHDDNPPCRGDFISDPRPLSGVRVCYFGRFDPQYNRNIILAKCLERSGAHVIRIRDDRGLPARTPSLVTRALRERFDAIVVGFRAHSDMIAARALATLRGVPLVFDPLTSRYEEKVIDRRLVGPRTPLAWWYRTIDGLGCRVADRVLLETDQQIDHFARTFNVPRDRFRRVFLGADDEVLRPQPMPVRPPGAFTVFFYGWFSPLHGVEHIIDAAARLESAGEPARFVLVGSGQTLPAAKGQVERLGLRSVAFLPGVPYADLGPLMADADICLGSFGTTDRASRVVANKVYDALAVARPVITADTPAARDVLTHGETAWLCAPSSGEALADALRTLRRQPDLLRGLAARGYDLFTSRFSLEALSRDLAAIMSPLLRNHRAHPVSR
jgi:glycosyltransferase involved in cell wall biosynthesis